jgi:hypothetical protein
MPVRCADDAMYLMALAVKRPVEHEVLACLLGPGGRSVDGTVLSIPHAARPDQVLVVVELCCELASFQPLATQVLAASVRPDSGVLPGDVDRWLEASAMCESVGLQLVEWFVIGPHGFECPRDLLGEPERWSR